MVYSMQWKLPKPDERWYNKRFIEKQVVVGLVAMAKSQSWVLAVGGNQALGGGLARGVLLRKYLDVRKR